MEPREEVEELANHLINKCVDTRLRAINLAEHLIREGYSRHPHVVKGEGGGMNLHQLREIITAIPIKNTNYRWRISERNKNIGWNECRLEMLERLGELAQRMINEENEK